MGHFLRAPFEVALFVGGQALDFFVGPWLLIGALYFVLVA